MQAYVYTKASKIVGVEMNAELCNIQNKLIKKYNFQVCIRFTVPVGDIFSDILSFKPAPSSVFFSYAKTVDWITSHSTGSILCDKCCLSLPSAIPLCVSLCGQLAEWPVLI